MKKTIKHIFLLMAAICLSAVAIAMPEAYVVGEHYKTTTNILPTTDETKIEVVEIFSYSCPHCFKFEPQVEEWKKTLPENVNFVQIPAIFRDSWLLQAKVFYAAQALGLLEQLHPALFHAIHVEKRRLSTEDQLLDFVAEQGVDRAEFEKMMNSFSVQAQVKKALSYSQNSGITGVPAMVVNGKYRTDAPIAGSFDEMLDVVDFLILKEGSEQ